MSRGFNTNLRKLSCNMKQPNYSQIPNVKEFYYRIIALVSAISKKILETKHDMHGFCLK